MTLLAAGAIVYGLIAVQGAVICADNGCESASGPGLGMACAALLAATIAGGLFIKAVPGRIGWWTLGILCVAVAITGGLDAVLWAGALLGSVFRDFANPWYNVAFFSGAANYLAYASSTSPHRIFWLGWPAGAAIELALDALATGAIAIGAVLVARTARRSGQPAQSQRFGSASSIVLITAFALMLDIAVTIPTEARDAIGFRAAHYLDVNRRALIADMNAVLSNANHEGDTGTRATDIGSGYGMALRKFTDSLAAVQFPDWSSAQLATEKAALTDEIVAATDLGTAASNGTYPDIQSAYSRLDDALQRENEAERALYLALFPQEYLHAYLHR